MTFLLDRSFVFEADPAALWDVLSQPEDYPRWWTWLRRIDTDGLVEGTTARCLIRAPIPWPLRLDLHIERVVPEECIQVEAGGDLRGPAALEIDRYGRGSAVRLTWELEPKGILRAAGPFSSSLLQWGQDWVVRTGVRQFRRRALMGR